MIGTRTSERESAQVGKSLTSNNFAYCNVYNSVKCVLGGAKLAFNLGLISFEETVELIMFEIFQIAFVNLMELNKKKTYLWESAFIKCLSQNFSTAIEKKG